MRGIWRCYRRAILDLGRDLDVLGFRKLERFEACGEAVDRAGEKLIVGEIGERTRTRAGRRREQR